MRYVKARIQTEQRDTAYRIYVTDALKGIVTNTSTAEESVGISVRYAELIAPKKEETRTPEEVIDSIKKKLES